MPDYSTEIAQIEALLNSGAKKVSVDGQTVEVDHGVLQKRLTYLRANDSSTEQADKRPRSAQINLGGAF